MDTTNTLEHEISADTNTMVDHKTETTTNPADEISVDAFQSLRVSETKKIIKVGINGFDPVMTTLGTLIAQTPNFELVAVNDTISFYKDNDPNKVVYMDFGTKKVPCYSKCVNLLDEIPWGAHGAEFVIECIKSQPADHLKGGAKKVILSDQSSDFPQFVVGVNDDDYNPRLKIISAGSSITNCIAPLLKVIHERFGIVEGFISTIQPSPNPYTSSIAAFVTYAARDVGIVIPSLHGKLAGDSTYFCRKINDKVDFAFADLTIRLQTPARYQDIKNAIKEESEGKMKTILHYTEDNVESTQFSEDLRSIIFDSHAGVSLSDTFVKVVARYNNPYGYFSRILDLIKKDKSMSNDY